MTLSRLFLLLAAAALTAGCASQRPTGDATYTKLRVTGQRGQVLSEWVARGRIERVERGYRITAVERISGPPYSRLSKYPHGWRTTVTGPHILRWRCGQPYWLYLYDDE